MNRVLISKIADYIGGRLIGKDIEITKITTDSRESAEGVMFIGIKGERVDGNDFAADFLKNGGSCAVVEKEFEVPLDKSVILVADTKKAIRDIAEYYRSTLDIGIVAVTGSVGKTSTKDMLKCVISQRFNTLATKGNFNNEIGLPLTVFELDNTYQKAVLEMGMNNLGEISRLTKIAKPDIAVITNIGTAHIGNLGSRENILRAKLEVAEGLSENGVLILNADDDMLWNVNNTHKRIYCGIDNTKADYVAYDITADENGSSFKVRINGIEHCLRINVAGKHHIYNALSAMACGLLWGMTMEEIVRGVSKFAPSGLRQNEVLINGIKLIEDCYNASAASMKSSMEMLNTIAKGARTVAVLGDILEQGDFAEQTHREAGRYAAELKMHTLVTVGKDARFIADEARNSVENIFEFDNNDTAAEFMAKYLKHGDIVLLKASRGMKFEEISHKLQDLLKG